MNRFWTNYVANFIEYKVFTRTLDVDDELHVQNIKKSYKCSCRLFMVIIQFYQNLCHRSRDVTLTHKLHHSPFLFYLFFFYFPLFRLSKN